MRKWLLHPIKSWKTRREQKYVERRIVETPTLSDRIGFHAGDPYHAHLQDQIRDPGNPQGRKIHGMPEGE